eukprot:3540361-Amphidinium_carterae.1
MFLVNNKTPALARAPHPSATHAHLAQRAPSSSTSKKYRLRIEFLFFFVLCAFGDLSNIQDLHAVFSSGQKFTL